MGATTVTTLTEGGNGGNTAIFLVCYHRYHRYHLKVYIVCVRKTVHRCTHMCVIENSKMEVTGGNVVTALKTLTIFTSEVVTSR